MNDVRMSLSKTVLASDLTALGAVLAGCAAAYLFWIGPNLHKSGSRSAAADLHSQREMVYKAARMRCMGIRRALHDAEQQVERDSGGMPTVSIINQRIAALTSTAQANGVIIEEVEPGPALPDGEHLETKVRFRARTTYSQFRRFLRDLEQRMSFLDVTHFSMSALSGPSNGTCRITWVVRMYSRPHEPLRAAANDPASARTAHEGSAS